MVETRRSSSSSKRTLSSPCSSPIPRGKRSKGAEAASSSTTGTPVEPIEAVVKESSGCESQGQEVRPSDTCKKDSDVCEEVTGVDVPEKSPVVQVEGQLLVSPISLGNSLIDVEKTKMKANSVSTAINRAKKRVSKSKVGVSWGKLLTPCPQMSSENSNTFVLKSILEKDKLNNTNFIDWHSNLRIVLKMAKKLYVLDCPVPHEPQGGTDVARKAWEKHNEDAIEVACLMQATMSSDLQKNLEDMNAFDMITQLKGMFEKQARQERYDTMKQLISCRMQEGSSVSAHVLKMKGYIDYMARLGHSLSNELAGDFILQSLPSSYDEFVMNYNMNVLEKTVSELHAMLKIAEMVIPTKTSQVLTVRSAGVKKPDSRGKGFHSKRKKIENVAIKHDTNNRKLVAKPPPSEERKCFHCSKTGHWKRNCPDYLAKLKKNRPMVPAL